VKHQPGDPLSYREDDGTATVGCPSCDFTVKFDLGDEPEAFRAATLMADHRTVAEGNVARYVKKTLDAEVAQMPRRRPRRRV
jgi:hypothetical protein